MSNRAIQRAVGLLLNDVQRHYRICSKRCHQILNPVNREVLAGSFCRPAIKNDSGAILRLARVFVRFDHVASVIVNANHSIV
jgi:hypothetical protein